MYTVEDIKQVISGNFLPAECTVDLIDENGGKYQFKLVPHVSMSMKRYGDVLEELFDSGLFDITNHGGYAIVEFLDPILERYEFNYIQEAKKWISFNDKQVKNIETLWKSLPDKHKNNTFYKSVYDQLVKNKKLSKRQFDELNTVLKTGTNRYDDDLFTVKN